MTTRALVVGINAYAPPNALPSCVQDAQSFSQLLTTKYRFGEIKTLTDDQATKAGVLNGLQWLFAKAAPGDQLVFFYSGHGYQPVVDGELREALVTQDSQFLDDTELAAAIASVPNGVLSIVLDTCFSGGLEKVFIDDKGSISQVVKAKYWTPPPAAPAAAAAAVQDKSQAKTFRPFGTVAPAASKGFVPAGTDATVTSLQLPASKGLLMSAAQADETASASTPSTNGMSAFTYALLDAVDADGADTAAITLVRAAGSTLHRIGLRQTPAIKQPIVPPGMGNWSFLTLQPLQPSPAGTVAGSFATQPQENFMTSPYLALAAPSTPWGATPDKSWIDSITSIVSTVVPVVVPIVARGLQSKGFAQQLPLPMTAPTALGSAADKDWLSSITSIVNTVVPAVVPVVAQALQSKGFVPQAAYASSSSTSAADKNWLDSITSIVNTVVPAVVPVVAQALQSKGFVPQAAYASSSSTSAADKNWLDSITSIVNTVVPAVVPVVAQALQSKGFVPQAPMAAPGGIALPSLDDKSWIDVVTRVATTAAPIALALL